MTEAPPAGPTIQDVTLTPEQITKLCVTVMMRIAKATGSPFVVSAKEVNDAEVGVDIKLIGGKNFVVTVVDTKQMPNLVRADATVLARLNNGSALAGIG